MRGSDTIVELLMPRVRHWIVIGRKQPSRAYALNCALCVACETGSTAGVSTLLQGGANKDAYRSHPLEFAVRRGHRDVVATLLDLVGMSGAYGPAQSGQAQLLLTAGASPAAYGFEPLRLACAGRLTAIAEREEAEEIVGAVPSAAAAEIPHYKDMKLG